MRAELIDCENTILREIADPEMMRRDVAQTYSLILQSPECRTVSWANINGAIGVQKFVITPAGRAAAEGAKGK